MIQIIDNVFDWSNRKELIVEYPITAGELIAARPTVPTGAEWIVQVNGKRVDNDYIIKQNTEAYVILVPAGGNFFRLALFAILAAAVPTLSIPGFGAFGLGLLRAAAFILGSLVINALVPVRAPGAAIESSPSYGWEGVSNSAQRGIPVAVVYGEHRVGGNVISITIEGAGKNERMHVLVALCEGIVDKISDVEIDQQPASEEGVPLSTGEFEVLSGGTGFDATGLRMACRLGYRDQDSMRTNDEIDFDDILAQNVYTDAGAPGVEIQNISGTIGKNDSISSNIVTDKEAKFVTNNVNPGMDFVMDVLVKINPPGFSARIIEYISPTQIRINSSYWNGLQGTYTIRYFSPTQHRMINVTGSIKTADGDSILGRVVTDLEGIFNPEMAGPTGLFTFAPYPKQEVSATIDSVISETVLELDTVAFNGLKGDYVIPKPVVRQATKLGLDYTKAWITLVLPRGRGRVTDDGKVKPWLTRILIQYRAIGSSDWLKLPDQRGSADTEVIDGVVQFLGDDITAWSETFKVHTSENLLTPDQYEFRFTRLSAAPTGIQNERATEVRLLYITEAVEANLSYPHTALLGIRAVSVSQLNGRLPLITCLVRGRRVFDPRIGVLAEGVANLNTFSGDTLTDATQQFITDGVVAGRDYVVINRLRAEIVEVVSETELKLRPGSDLVSETGVYKIYPGVWSDNPALIFRDILLSILDPMGWHSVLEPIQARIDDDQIIEWANWCDETLPDYGNEKRCRCDIVFDEETEVWNALQAVAAVGRANLVQVGTKFSVVIDRPRPVTGMYTLGSAINKSYSSQYLPLDTRAQSIEVEYQDRDYNWRRDVVNVPGNDLQYLDKPATLDARGITRRSQAIRQGKMYLLHSNIQDRAIQIAVPFEHIQNIVGDVVKFQHDSLRHETFGGRPVAYDPDSSILTINRKIKLDPEENYICVIRMPEGSIETRSVVSVSNYDVTLNAPLDFGESNVLDAVYTIGPVDTATKLMQIVSTEVQQDGSGLITMVDYDESIYERIDSVDELDPSAITESLNSRPSAVKAVSVDVLGKWQDGLEGIRLQASWAADRPYYGAEVMMQVNRGPMRTIGRTAGETFIFDAPVRPEDHLTVRIVPLNAKGEFLPALGAAFADKIIEQSTKGTGSTDSTLTSVPNVFNLSFQRNEENVFLNWKIENFPTFKNFEVRRGISWPWAEPVGHPQSISFNLVTHAPFTYLVKAKSTTDRESPSAAGVLTTESTAPDVSEAEHVKHWSGNYFGASSNTEFDNDYAVLLADNKRDSDSIADVPDFYYEVEIDFGGIPKSAYVILQLASYDDTLLINDMLDPMEHYTLYNGWTFLGNMEDIAYELTVDDEPFTQGQRLSGVVTIRVSIYAPFNSFGILSRMTVLGYT